MPTPNIIRPLLVDKRSPFIGEACALCKQPFAPGDELVICPDDGARHHVHCWRANQNQCTAFGCNGHGEVLPRRVREQATRPRTRPVTRQTSRSRRDSKVRAMPSSNFGCARGCLLMSIAVAIVLIAVGCFGLWAIADYIMIEVLGWQYRAPFSAAALPHLVEAGLRDGAVLLASRGVL